jgi:hypothetical protein
MFLLLQRFFVVLLCAVLVLLIKMKVFSVKTFDALFASACCQKAHLVVLKKLSWNALVQNGLMLLFSILLKPSDISVEEVHPLG